MILVLLVVAEGVTTARWLRHRLLICESAFLSSASNVAVDFMPVSCDLSCVAGLCGEGKQRGSDQS